jgi:hypothetical protein
MWGVGEKGGQVEEEVDTCLCILLVFESGWQQGTENGEQGPRGAGAVAPLAPPVRKVAAQPALPFPQGRTDTNTRTQNLSA